MESPHVVPLPPFYIQNPLKSWIPEIYILEKVEPSVGCTIVEHLNCTAHNGLWMDWRNNPNHSNGPGRVLCTSKKHHFCAYLGVLFIEIDSSFWKIFSKNFRGELSHIEIPSFAGWIQNMDARPQKFINYNRCIIRTLLALSDDSTKKKWIQTDKNFTSSVHFLKSQKYRGVHQWECPRACWNVKRETNVKRRNETRWKIRG